MKGIVGRKLGMTRVFDAETGVVTPVTVIEAEPCPVVEVKTADTHGYDAVQIAYDSVAERKITKPELGHLKKNGVEGAFRHLVELRGQSPLVVGENVTVEVFEPGEKVKVSGISHGKGFAGTIKRHKFHRGPKTHGSHNIRKPGSIILPEGQEMVMPGDNTNMEIELIQPIAMDQGLRFAIREGGRTVGAGVVTEVIK